MTEDINGVPPHPVPAVRERLRRFLEVGDTLTSSYPWHFRGKTTVLDYVASLGHESHEWLLALFVDSHVNLLSVETVALGTVQSVEMPTGHIIRRGLHLGASGYFLAHNHPSGDATPSLADIRATNELGRVTEIVDLTLLEHFIIARESWCRILWDGGRRRNYLELVEKGDRLL